MLSGCFCLLVSDLREQKKVESGEESLDALQEVFEQIQTVTGEDKTDLLVSWFTQGKSFQSHSKTGNSYCVFGCRNKQHSFSSPTV